MHRADVHGVLVRAFDAGGDSLRLYHQLTDIEQDHDKVSLGFADGESDRCDVVVACDGIKSTVRDRLFTTEPPKFTGLVAWRGLVDRQRVPDISLDPHFAAFPAENKLFGRYPIRHDTLINYVAIARKPDFHLESWAAYGDISEVLAEFADWYEDVGRIIRATPADRCLRWAMHSRQPLDSWVDGRVTLLGDAAHPITPFLGMGAVVAIEDAAVLARCFEAAGEDWRDALQRYERARLQRANKIHMDSIKQGEAYLGTDPTARGQAPGVGQDEVYLYDAMSTPI
jgi:salicylate hydroxylase